MPAGAPAPPCGSTRAMNFTRMPSTSRMAVRRMSLTPWPGAPRSLNLSASFALTKDSVSTSSARARGVAVTATSQALRLAFSTASTTDGQESRSCSKVTGPTGAAGAVADGASAGGALVSDDDEGSSGADAAGADVPVSVGFASGAGSAAATGAGVATGAGAAAGAGVATGATAAGAGSAPASATPTRRSRRSTRARAPRCVSSLAGTSTRATSSSRWRRGEVAPVISVRAALTTSAARDSSTAPKATAWARMRSSSSSGVPRSTAAAPSTEVAPTMMRSRRRSRRSSTKRRGSWPVWMTRSTPAKAPAASCRATESMTSSSSAACV
ncbi:hypothetical protein DOU02_10775 [Clavibacter michiganensis subsp. michiganensis]|nr:hypothetical protein DOU02_10775 [Clavibacter michiganensis subsp. michiganensis]